MEDHAMSDPFANNTADVQNPKRLTHWRRRALEGRGFKESNPFIWYKSFADSKRSFSRKKIWFLYARRARV
jgi:hypothetical protein